VFAHDLVLTELSKACLLVGRVDQAHACRLLGDVAMHRDPPDVDQAAAHYRQVVALAEEVGMRPLQAHCHHGLGTLYATTGQREQARVALAAAIDLYRAMDMTFWLPQAEAALAQMSACDNTLAVYDMPKESTPGHMATVPGCSRTAPTPSPRRPSMHSPALLSSRAEFYYTV
jgi:hypothetical protein